MNSFLLYEETDRLPGAGYFDAANIIQDLNLEALFFSASQEAEYENGKIKRFGKEDPFIRNAVRKIMMIPLQNEEQILFRQEILQDFLENEDVIRRLYVISSRVIEGWNMLGRDAMRKSGSSHPSAKLIADIHIITLFFENLKELKKLLSEYQAKFRSRGLNRFISRLDETFSEEKEAYIQKILQDISFFTQRKEENDSLADTDVKPRIILEAGLEEGLKFSVLKLQEVASLNQRMKSGGAFGKIRDFIHSWAPDSFPTANHPVIREQVSQLELQVAAYLLGSISSFIPSVGAFFDSLHLQSAFYLGAVNLKHLMSHFDLPSCFPKVCEKDRLAFRELKEFVMCLVQRIHAIGNTCSMDHKMLLIVTGANQGGKSTFLRSIGLAQVMMQSGLMVSAQSFESAVFPDLFTHFTRREDSAMNSGRLDEELKRMNRIVENLGERPLVLLNESFASTTEKEGSVIAYDIVKALNEAGVKILIVTHLLSFAQRLYQESQTAPDTDIEFLSAERKENGARTFRMIQHAPELTSFGLDLFQEIVENKLQQSGSAGRQA